MIQCANPRCSNPVSAAERRRIAANKTSLCTSCSMFMEHKGLPVAGFVPSDTLAEVSRNYLRSLWLSKTDLAVAERYARGPRYRRGVWSERPPYNLYKLNKGRAKERLPELILGREAAPTAMAIVKSFAHYRLALDILGTGHRYGLFLAGSTFLGRQGTHWPQTRKGEVRLGSGVYSHKSPVYLFKPRDLLIVGTHALRSAERLGLNRDDTAQAADILRLFHEVTADGSHQPMVHFPRYAMRTKRAGDHPLTHWIGPKADVPKQYLMKYRRANGKIGGVWPVGIEPGGTTRQANEETKPTVTVPNTKEWLFARFPQTNRETIKETSNMATRVTLGHDGNAEETQMINTHGGVTSSTEFQGSGVEVRRGGFCDFVHDPAQLKDSDQVVWQGLEVRVDQAKSMGIMDELFGAHTSQVETGSEAIEAETEGTTGAPKSDTGNVQYDEAVDGLNGCLDAGTMTMEEATPYDTANGSLAFVGVTPDEAWSTLHGLAEGTLEEGTLDPNQRSAIEAARDQVYSAATRSAISELGPVQAAELEQLAEDHPSVHQVLWRYSIDRAQGQHDGVTWTELFEDLRAHFSEG